MPKKSKKSKKKKTNAPSAPSAVAKGVPKNANPQALPKREEALFVSLVENYDKKCYKKALKLADQILLRFPENGKTIAMKGLTLGLGMKNMEEGFALAKTGLRHDMKNHVCWHVYGLLYRSDRNYAQAMKCYQQALKINKNNMGILSDLALLQVQQRNFDKYCESRRQLLVNSTKQSKTNWVGFAIAHYLAGHYDVAIGVIDQYLGTFSKTREPDYQDSELTMLKVLIYQEKGDLDQALKCLLDNDKMVSDRESYLSKCGELYIRTGQFAKAARIYLRLVHSNTENYEFHRGLQTSIMKLSNDDTDYILGGKYLTGGCDLPADIFSFDFPNMVENTKMDYGAITMVGSRGGSDDENVAIVEKLTNLYNVWRKKYTRSQTCERIPLSFLPNKEYLPRVETYIIGRLKRGVLSLFSDLKPTFCHSQERFNGVLKIGLSCVESLRSNGTFPKQNVFGIDRLNEEMEKISLSKKNSRDNDQKKENPQVLVWALTFVSKCYDLNGEYAKALSCINEAIEHTPTILELIQWRGRIEKHMGDLEKAEQSLNYAREIDLQDRYINTKHVKYLMRVNRVDAAHETAGLFTKHENDPVEHVFYMQVMWQELEEADSHHRVGKYAAALKRYNDVHRHFTQFSEDQFDFHSYCLRKSTVRAYLGMIRLIDQKSKHVYFRRSTIGLARVYLKIADESEETKTQNIADLETQVKEYEEKKKKAKVYEFKSKEDKDPKGLTLYKEKDPLKKAWSYVGMLLKTNVDVPETHYLAYDVASKLKKPCLQLRALLQLKRLVPLTCGTIRRVQHFFDSKCNDQLKQQALIEQSLLLLADYDNSMDTYVNKYVESINKISMHYTLKQSCKRENIKTDGLDINGLKNALISVVKQ
jgi:N-alpha-acetyltransferase 15/16, NatA auxiliary subunit